MNSLLDLLSKKVYELTDVSEEDVDTIQKSFEADGAVSTEILRQSKGKYTVRAIFDK